MLQPLSSVCIRVSSETFLHLLFLMDVAAECERETLEKPAGLFCFLVCEGFGCFGFPDSPPLAVNFLSIALFILSGWRRLIPPRFPLKTI